MDNFTAVGRHNKAVQDFMKRAEKIMKGYYAKLHDVIEHEECNISRNRMNIFFKNGRSVELFLDLDGLKYEWDNSAPFVIESEFDLPTILEVADALGLKVVYPNCVCC